MRLGYELSIRPVGRAEDDQLELITINLQVVEIGDQFINGLENVELGLLMTASGKLMIGKLETTLTNNPVINPSENGKKCSTLICKWRAIVADKFAVVKGSKGCGSKTKGTSSGRRPHKHSGPPRLHKGPHHQHHKHHRAARLLRMLKGVAIHVLIPIIIGVAVGMTASLIGMLVGNFVIFLWRAVYRRGQRGSYSVVKQDDNVVSEELDNESKAFLDHQGPPPVYEDVVTLSEKPAQ